MGSAYPDGLTRRAFKGAALGTTALLLIACGASKKPLADRQPAPLGSRLNPYKNGDSLSVLA
ncbi:MAG TPA: hypothetical protein VFW90_01015, partial [Candidatus Saccharimonadales bacterium]|nr:hypothetical protein [Candidatus Saccharimonadales bacterium]